MPMRSGDSTQIANDAPVMYAPTGDARNAATSRAALRPGIPPIHADLVPFVACPRRSLARAPRVDRHPPPGPSGRIILRMPTVIVIGDGPGGLSAALFLAKNKVDVVVFGEDKTAMNYAHLKNYLGLPEIGG